MTFVLGLTGSIGMGKSATAAMFAALGVPVHDADAVVHALYRGRRRPARSRRHFRAPSRTGSSIVRRSARRCSVEPERLKELEAIVHPLVRAERDAFLAARGRGARAGRGARHPAPVRDRRRARCDAVLVVTAPRRCSARASSPAPGHDRGEVRSDSGEADAGRGKAATRRISLWTPSRGFAAAERQVGDILRALAGRPGRMLRSDGRRPEADACARSSSTPRRRAPIRPPATASIEIGCVELLNQLPDRAHLPRLSQPAARGVARRVRRPRPLRGLPRRQAGLRRRSPTSSWSSSATGGSSSTTPASTSPS